MRVLHWWMSSLAAGGLLVAWAQPSGVGPASAPGSSLKPMVVVRLLDEQGKLLPRAAVPKVIKTEAEWQRQLTAEQYQIARGKGTERAFCGVFYDNHKPGVYYCVCCDLPLFTSEAKFDSGTGWPSFFQPVAAENVLTRVDSSFGLRRVEVLCARCEAHLGHVFEDGPRPTGLRYCMNSASFTFKDNQHLSDATSGAKK